MKKLIIVFAVFLLLVGCNTSTGDITPSLHAEAPSISPVDSNINEEKVNDFNVYLNSDYQMYEDIPSWEEYFKQKTGIEIQVNYMDGFGVTDPKQLQKDGAIYYVGSQKLIYRIIDDISLSPLNKYYDLYNWYQYIDQAYVDLLRKGDDILAIPCISQPFVRARFYNKTYLEQTGLKVPETTDEFMNFLIDSHKSNPKQYQIVINLNGLSRQLADIFRAYDIYVSTYNNSMIGFNPKTSSFEDGVFSENFVFAYSYLQTLREMEILLFNPPGINGYTINYPLATEYSMIYSSDYSYMEDDQTTPDFEYEKGYYLRGINQ
ncbi:MAG: extracellular solute-binding protein [Clostridia bacterium]|nr:extracellular solute-binding protein [Clostridia bacterium]